MEPGSFKRPVNWIQLVQLPALVCGVGPGCCAGNFAALAGDFLGDFAAAGAGDLGSFAGDLSALAGDLAGDLGSFAGDLGALAAGDLGFPTGRRPARRLASSPALNPV